MSEDAPNESEGRADMRVWTWLLTVVMGLTVSLGGIVYGNMMDVDRNLNNKIESQAATNNSQDHDIVSMKKDSEVLQRDVKELKDSVKGGFDNLNRRLDGFVDRMDQKDTRDILREDNRNGKNGR